MPIKTSTLPQSGLLACCLVVLLAPGTCKSATGDSDDGLVIGGMYSWRGTIVDGGTGLPARGIAIRVRERGEHEAVGWSPDPTVTLRGPDEFFVHYVLSGPVCAGRRDTTLTLHLEFVDTLGSYLSRVHTSQWALDYCDGTPPPATPKPYPSEDGLLIRMQAGP